MKKNKLIIGILTFIGLAFMACEPQLKDKPDIGLPPSETDLNFTISSGVDAFHVVVTNTSTVTGIAKWDFGNGAKGEGEVAVANYVLPDTYVITLTLITNGGVTSITKEFVQTETDFSIFSDPVYLNLSGGTTATEGKTWVVDSTQSGHFGVGPVGGTWPEWWPANPLQKAGGGAYDDEFNFNINEFVFTQNNHGDNYVSLAISDKSFYSNPVPVDGADVRVNYNPTPGSWNISDEDGTKYLTLIGTTPLYFGFDNGIVDGKYRIDEIQKDLLKVSGVGFDGNRWYYQLIPKGYVKPKVTFDLVTAPTGNDNEFTLRLNNIVYPENGNLSIINVTWDFGDPSQEAYETSNPEEVVTVTYMPAGTYTVKVTFTDNAGTTYEATEDIIVATDHPDYTPYIEANMMMYTNFDDYFRPIGIDGGGGSFKLVANPSVVYQNESAFCVEFTKVDDPWANIYIQLSDAYRFDLVLSNKFKLLVYGTAGNEVLLKLENKDLGGNSWTTGTPDQKYTIQESNKWEVAEFTLTGVDADKLQNYYNRILVMLNAGNGSGTFTVKIDDWAGPLVSGWKK